MRDLKACGLGGLVVREDTGLVAVDVSSRGDSAAAGGCGGGGSGFVIREDTSFHDMPAMPASGGGGFMIREDTNLKGFHLQVSSASRFHAHLLFLLY